MTDKPENEPPKQPAWQFQPNNQLWKLRQSHGHGKAFDNLEEFYGACVGYFQWLDDNPLYEYKAFGTGMILRVPKMRYPTINGLCLHIGISHKTFLTYQAEDHEFQPVAEYANDMIKNMKLEGAASGFFNQLITARDVGLKEKQEVDTNMSVNVIDTFVDDGDDE